MVIVDYEEEVSSEFSMSQVNKVTLPPTNKFIDKQALKECLARGSYELYKYVKKGETPIFGYPHICYDENSSNHERERNYKRIPNFIYSSMIKRKSASVNKTIQQI